MSGHIIRQLEEKFVSIKVDLMVWSKKMDLIAISNYKGEVALHRLTWQRVWLLPPPDPEVVVRKIAWRPDGKVIAIAYVPKVLVVGKDVEGEVRLIDVENKEMLHRVVVTDDITCLVWLQEKLVQEYAQHVVGNPNTQDGTSDFLPKLPSLNRTFGSLPDNVEENLEDSKRIKDQTQLNFILIGTSDGNVYMSVFGLFSCGVININRFMTEEERGKHTSVLDADISPNMKSLFLLVAVDEEPFYAATVKDENASNKEEATGSKTKSSGNKTQNSWSSDRQREIKVVILDTRVLYSRSRELHALSMKYGYIISLLEYMSQTMRSIIEAWENIYLLEIESKLSKHAESLPPGTLSADFLELLLFGVPSELLENFLLKELNDKGIKKLGHSIELSHSNIQKLILKHLLSVGQSLAYHLAEMKGMANLADRFKILGLEAEAVAEAFSAAGAFLIKATEVQLVIDESMKRYKAFFRWLYAVILRITDDRIPDLTMTDINQQDLEFIADYLNNLDVTTDVNGVVTRHCYLDRLGQYLMDKDLTNPVERENNCWQQLLEENPCLKDHFCIVDRHKNTSLVQQHTHLREAIHNVFRTPEFAIGNLFQLRTIVDIADTTYTRLTMSLVEDYMILIAMIQKRDSDMFRLVQITADANQCYVMNKGVTFKSPDKRIMECLDVQFYLPEVLSVLLQEPDENKYAVIAQVQTKSVYNKLTDIVDGESLDVVMRQIPDLVASNFAVSGSRKLAIVLSESRRKVRLFEMEAEDEDEEDEMTEGYNESQKGYFKVMKDIGPCEEIEVEVEANGFDIGVNGYPEPREIQLSQDELNLN